MPNFALTLVRGPNWDDTRGIREQQQWSEHATFMDGLVADGFILLGGPLGTAAGPCTWWKPVTKGRFAADWPRIHGPAPDCCRSAPSNPGHSGSTSDIDQQPLESVRLRDPKK